MFCMDYGRCFIYSAFWVCFDFSRYVSYRFRLVSISCDPTFNFSIDGHQMTVIEVEGTNTQPLLIDSLQILVGAPGFIQLTCDDN
jgi:FtsP/CotA-like multicopper oxidase with cupredoxin domain